ncbi:MAG TPA: Ig-like domain-containing protein, partial [Polyangiales bacterium]|nr:Ig-like domain-containing protein [Polyangiales bacterium]
TSATLTVTQASLASITITPSNASIPRGFDVTFHATGTYTDSTTQDLTGQVTWISSDPTVATISNATGTAGTLSSSVTNAGAITVTASFNSRMGTTPFTVTPATLASIAITPNNGSIATCDCASLTVTGTFSDASQYDITSNSSLALASSDDNTVRVYQSGLVWLACSDSNAGSATVSAIHAGDNIMTMTTETNSGACN